jgi:branched-chain amino acid aminotransferase
MVRSFFVSGERVEELGPQPDMTAASRALPHGSYTTLRTYAGDRVLRLRQHAERLSRSLPEASPLEVERLRTAVVAALRATRFPESRLRLTYAPPDLFVSIEALAAPAAALYEQGVRCATLHLRRHNPRAKDTHFIDTAAGSLTALPPDANEGLMLAEDGAILEGLSSNFFAVLDGELRTEEARVLAGVTRAIVLEIARGLLPVRLEPIGRAQLGRVSEAFLTSVSREILPVVVVDAVTLGDGRPGPVTRELILRFQRLAAQEAESLGTRDG